MIDDRHEELAALYALDLLEDEERAVFEASLERDAVLRETVRELREAGASLAHLSGDVAPPAVLKDRILTRLAPRVTPTASVGQVLPFALPTWLPWAAAALLTVVSVWLGQLYLGTRAEVARLRDDQTLTSFEARTLRQQLEAERLINNRQLADGRAALQSQTEQLAANAARLLAREREVATLSARVEALSGTTVEAGQALAEAKLQLAALAERLQTEANLAQFKIATLASLAGNSPQAQAIAVWNPATQEGILQVAKLPALTDDQDYQLWVIDPQYPIPVDGGVFTVDPATGDARITFHPDKPVKTAAKFAVSLERKGGVPKAEGPILLLGD